MAERMAAAGDLTASNLTAGQIAGVLQLWGQHRGIELQLGVIVNGDPPSSRLSDANYNQYSGVKLIDPADSSAPVTKLDYSQKRRDSMAHVEQLTGTTAHVPALDVEDEASAPVDGYEEPDLGEYQKPSGFKSVEDSAGASSSQSSSKARVAWVAAQNKLVDDATLRITGKCPDQNVVRVLP
ncbi:hypothetical protein FBEOM_2746 [Fusarium beomiforme]|uniref:Uncharacterized protein n=1 Tax=Fusarium beomiforme TaxID=44412 RepID=A0A9P5ARD2_9HYPO|nr:hypothetical protein FBEOM_2746 [Fusarium beomiforme]